jgi:hypothetical protein
VVIEIDGGAVIGYWATARNGMASNPPRQIRRATTQAKTGRSTKKAGIDRNR